MEKIVLNPHGGRKIEASKCRCSDTLFMVVVATPTMLVISAMVFREHLVWANKEAGQEGYVHSRLRWKLNRIEQPDERLNRLEQPGREDGTARLFGASSAVLIGIRPIRLFREPWYKPRNRWSTTAR